MSRSRPSSDSDHTAPPRSGPASAGQSRPGQSHAGPASAAQQRPKAPVRHSVRDSLLIAATRLFARQGFGATSIQQIADAVGIRKPSLLYHFPSKEALRVAVLDAMLSRWSEVLPQLLLAAAREDRFDATMIALVDFFIDDPDRARLLLREALDRPEDMQQRMITHIRPWIDVVQAQLEAARGEGFVHEDADVGAYALQVVSLVVGGIAVLETLQSMLPEEPLKDNKDRLRQEMLRFARAGLFAKSPRSKSRSEEP